MVLEIIFKPFSAIKNRKLAAFLSGLLYSTLGVFLSIWVFREYASFIMVFLSAMAAMPFIYDSIKSEEKKDLKINDEYKLLKEHSKWVIVFIFIFIGLFVGFFIWHTVLPDSVVNDVFSTQSSTILSINSHVSGNFSDSLNLFSKIFFNNIKVLIFCILFAFLYGFGAIFILAWNASVVSTAAGIFFKNSILQKGLMYSISFSLLRYMIHGIPEMAGYMIGGLAGGIISVAIIRHDIRTKKFENILLDSSELLLIAIFILFIAALLEVFVTPLIF